ncbi:hypothetical protein LGL05_16105 [Clostridium tagluense]|uniref:hypothetical protein n=1 Tax=Clostridium tagluense TaxID=360422 RepID=UPI001CF57CD1|nr:hypothetical protein [Clostridium tagluense]MCB2299305.1 hypothetical protein [Clostridium tagluense]
MKNMFRDVLQEALETKMDSELGAVEVNIPRDRNSEFEPKINSFLFSTQKPEGLCHIMFRVLNAF